MAITAEAVKTLRERTGAGMMDCKKALTETNGDFEQAIDFLKKQGLAKAGKKSDRIAAEGLVFSKVTPERGVMVELNCETDFVAKNEDFLKAGHGLAELIHKVNPATLEDALNLPFEGTTVAEYVNGLVARIGEKITFRRFKSVVPKTGGRIGGYIHMGGKIVVLAEVTGAKTTDEVIKDVSMQVAAMNPRYVDKSQVPQEELAREKNIFLEQLKTEGKPVEILEKIVVGKLDKFASEISLMQQIFVKDPSGKKSVGQFLKDTDPQARVVQFERFAVGEGIEKRQENFADEVAKMIQ